MAPHSLKVTLHAISVALLYRVALCLCGHTHMGSRRFALPYRVRQGGNTGNGGESISVGGREQGRQMGTDTYSSGGSVKNILSLHLSGKQ